MEDIETLVADDYVVVHRFHFNNGYENYLIGARLHTNWDWFWFATTDPNAIWDTLGVGRFEGRLAIVDD